MKCCFIRETEIKREKKTVLIMISLGLLLHRYLFPYNTNLLRDIECGCHNCNSEGLTESLVSVSSRTSSENRVQSNNYGEIVTKSQLKQFHLFCVKKTK